MKKYVFLLLVLSTRFLFCQEKIIQERTILANELEIITYGLDDIVIENSKDDKLEVILLDENTHKHNILFKKEKEVLIVAFELHLLTFKDDVFRKYITRRLERARVIIKVPKNKHISVHGETIGVNSKSYAGDLSIYIERGNIQLNTIVGNTSVHLFQGNVFAQTTLRSKLSLTTNKGAILINDEKKASPFLKENSSAPNTLTINSIHANINIELE
ncbi:hypothetical protein [Tenacibaculum sp. SDUM215027]|uniref:hypothetical protein n=1 Tax=Tenacibaculum sp. SDUM215027 TaxID=3422596 RepID=UPI003D31C178